MGLMGNLTTFANSAYEMIQAPLTLAEHPALSASWRKLTRPKTLQLSARVIAAYRAVIVEKVSLIERLPSKYRKPVVNLVWNAVMRGYDEAGLAQALHDQFGFARDRARGIARVQCRMARSVLENAQRLENGFLNAVWLHHPGCTIASHGGFNFRRYYLRTGAHLDGKWVLPGGEPNCQCRSSAAGTPD